MNVTGIFEGLRPCLASLMVNLAQVTCFKIIITHTRNNSGADNVTS